MQKSHICQKLTYGTLWYNLSQLIVPTFLLLFFVVTTSSTPSLTITMTVTLMSVNRQHPVLNKIARRSDVSDPSSLDTLSLILVMCPGCKIQRTPEADILKQSRDTMIFCYKHYNYWNALFKKPEGIFVHHVIPQSSDPIWPKFEPVFFLFPYHITPNIPVRQT